MEYVNYDAIIDIKYTHYINLLDNYEKYFASPYVNHINKDFMFFDIVQIEEFCHMRLNEINSILGDEIPFDKKMALILRKELIYINEVIEKVNSIKHKYFKNIKILYQGDFTKKWSK